MKTQAFSLHSLPWLSNFETNQGYKDRQDPSLTLIFPINSDEAKFKDFGHLVWTTTPWTPATPGLPHPPAQMLANSLFLQNICVFGS